MDFKFDAHVPSNSPDMKPYKISKGGGAWPESYESIKFMQSLDRLLVVIVIIIIYCV